MPLCLLVESSWFPFILCENVKIVYLCQGTILYIVYVRWKLLEARMEMNGFYSNHFSFLNLLPLPDVGAAGVAVTMSNARICEK